MNVACPPSSAPVGLILAGGAAMRLGGGDKGLRPLKGRPLMQHIVETMWKSTDRVMLSANGPADRFSGFPWLRDVTIVPDTLPNRPGPLAGILAGMDCVRTRWPDRRDLVSVPCDAPFLPPDLFQRLCQERERQGAALAMATGPDGQGGWRLHPTVGLWSLSLRDALYQALAVEDMRKVRLFAERHGMIAVPFPAGPTGLDPFFNVNSPDDLAEAERIIRNAAP